MLEAAQGKLKALVVPFLMACAVTYFIYHAFSGDHGVLTLFSVNSQLESARAEHSALQAEREALEYKVNFLRADALNLDVLDEQARAVLGYAHADELVVLRQTGK